MQVQRPTKCLRLVASALLATAAAFSVAQTATLTGLGASFVATGLSRNGKVVVGQDGGKPAYWVNGTINDLSPLTGSANACNSDGSIIVGKDQAGNGGYWQRNGAGFTFIDLPILSGNNTANPTLISADGTIIAGYCSYSGHESQPVIWTTSGVYAIPDGTSSTILNSISDDGSTIVCDLTGNYGLVFNSFGSATQNPGVITISSGANGPVIKTTTVTPYSNGGSETFEDLFCVTSDGSSQFGGDFDLFQDHTTWYADAYTAIQEGAGDPNIFNYPIEIHSCSSDGTILAGQYVFSNYINQDDLGAASFSFGNSQIYFASNNHDFNNFITGKGATTTGWKLSNIPTQAMSTDGSVILGSGTDPSNATENFIATITPALNYFTSANSSVTGGNDIAVYFGIDYPAPTGGVTITISSNNPNVIANTTAKVPGGSSGGTVNLKTSSTTSYVTLTGAYGGGSKSFGLLVVANPLVGLTAANYNPVGGKVDTGYLQLGNAPSTGGAVVTLKSSNSGVTVPKTLTVAANATSATFTITSTPVSAPVSVTITATYGSSTESLVMTVVPPSLTQVRVAPSPVVSGTSTKCAVYLNGAAPTGGEKVTLASNNLAAQVPSSYTVPAGTTAGNFTVTTTAVYSPTTVTISGTVGSTTLTADFLINPKVTYPALTEFTTSAGAVAGANPVMGTVHLASAAAAGGDVVSLSSKSAAVILPANVTVPANALSVTFPITSSPVTATVTATLTATLGNSTVSASLNIIPAGVSLVRVSPAPVLGGVSTKGAVYLNGKAPAGGLSVQLASSIRAAQVPATMSVAPFATIGTFTVTTSPVSSVQTAVITVVSGSTRTDTTFVINPATFTSVTATPNPVVGGKTTSLTITMNGKAGPSGLVVTLKSSSADIVVPAAVTIPAGATTASVTLATLAVKATTAVTISATFGSATKTCVITLSP